MEDTADTSGPEFAQWVRGLPAKLDVEVVKRSDDVSGFKVFPASGGWSGPLSG